MKPVVKRKSIYYKRAEFSKKGGTLQDYLCKALKSAKKPNSRIEALDQEEVTRRLINSFRYQNNMIFGQMLRYETGKDQSILILDNDSDEYPVEKLKIPKRADGKAQEILESVLYFGILENHMVLLQSQALKARDLENHFMWLFRERTKVLPEKITLCLSDQPTKAARKKIEKMPVKKVAIGAPLYTEQETDHQEGEAKTEKMLFRPAGRGFDILSTVLGPDWRKGLRLGDSLDEANLRVNLEVTYHRKTTQAAHKILDHIATSMRHVEPDDVAVHLEGGSILKGQDLKFSGHVNVDTYNGIIDSSDLYVGMFDWLKSRIEEGTIT